MLRMLFGANIMGESRLSQIKVKRIQIKAVNKDDIN